MIHETSKTQSSHYFLVLFSIVGMWLLPTLVEGAVWVSGSNQRSQTGVYGTKGIPALGNVPGSRVAGSRDERGCRRPARATPSDRD